MSNKQSPLALLLAAGLLIPAPAAWKEKENPASAEEKHTRRDAALWSDPKDIASRDLFYGPGGKEHVPHGSVRFIKEDPAGTNPKFVVKDETGVRWKVKLGSEAQPETAASRLIWAIGYFANEDYFVRDLPVQGLPHHLHRGQKYVAADGQVHNVRLKRYLKDEEKTANWTWDEDVFTGTQEENGLRVLMALINNWDLTQENNSIYDGESGRIFMVSDVGSTFGSGRLTWPLRKSRGNLDIYRRSRFITKVTPDCVDFYTPAAPGLFFLATPREYLHKLRLRWIGRHIPRADARWTGQLLARLSGNQIRDAFRAAEYSAEDIEGFAQVVELRIRELQEL
jgi:hypothetical protein